jgi:signal transduction histidine kinase
MPRRSHPQCRPRWWPEDQPWPPRGPGNLAHQARARFFRRFALMAIGMMLIAFAGLTALGWMVATRLGTVGSQPFILAPLAVLAGLFVLAVVGGAVRTFRRFGTPLASVMDAADRVAAGEYSTRVREYGPPPIRALARSFNTMTERLERNERLRRDLMADIAHELRTPLTIMQGKLEGLVDGVYALDEMQLRQLLDETRVLSRLVEDLRTLALSESGTLKLPREPTALAALVREVQQAFAAGAAARGVALHVDADETLGPIDVDPVRMREVIGNLLSNAASHTPAGGSITLRVAGVNGVGTVIEVRDTGVGMTAEQLAHAFDRFYKGAESRGSGLGLTIAKGLIEAHGGEIHASSEPGHGTTMTVTIRHGQ